MSPRREIRQQRRSENAIDQVRDRGTGGEVRLQDHRENDWEPISVRKVMQRQIAGWW